MHKLFQNIFVTILVTSFLCFPVNAQSEGLEGVLQWSNLPDLPDKIGVAGPFAGVHLNPEDTQNEVLIVAGGANFSVPEDENLWELPKRYHDKAWILKRRKDDTGDYRYEWMSGFKINQPLAYGASVSSEFGVVCIGGEDGKEAHSDVFLLSWDTETEMLKQTSLPSLPEPVHGCSAAMIGNAIYVAGGMSLTGSGSLASATKNFWSLDMTLYGDSSGADEFVWKKVLPWPGSERAMAVAVSQHNGFDQCLYLLSGRRALAPDEENSEAIKLSDEEALLPLRDVYEFCPAKYDATAYDSQTGEYTGGRGKEQPWRKRTDAPFAFMAGAGAAIGQSHIFILAGADGSNLREVFDRRKIAMKDYEHPGFSKHRLAYHTITDTWVQAGDSPSNQVTTPAVKWGEGIIENTSGRGSSMLVTIKFDSGTKKTLMAEYAKLKKVIQLGDS